MKKEIVSSNKLVSVIVPVFNSERYLTKCIESIINQTYQDLEIIIINDGSVDSSLSICQNFKKQDNRIIVTDKDNTGVSNTRNIGMDVATGDYVIFIDSDDYIENNMIELMVKAFDQYDVDVVRCNAIIYKKGSLERENNYNLSIVSNTTTEEFLSHFFTSNKTIRCLTPTLLIKRNKLIKFDEALSYMEDSFFYMQLLSNIDSMYFMSEALYHYNYNTNSVTKDKKNGIINVYKILDSVKKIITYIKPKKYSFNFVQDIYANAFNLIINQLYNYCSIIKIHKAKKDIECLYENDNFRILLNKVDEFRLSNIKKLLLAALKKKRSILVCVLCKIIGSIKHIN